MKKPILSFLTLALIFASVAAQGQTETLSYQGSPFAFVDNQGSLNPPPPGNPFAPPVPVAALDDSITGSLVLSNPLIANGNEAVIPVSYEFSLGSSLLLTSDTHSPYYNFGGSAFSFTMANGAITGFDFAAGWHIGGPGGRSLSVSGGSGGDQYEAALNTCGSGNASQNCWSRASSLIPGTWSVSSAPEIDPASAAGGLTLLFGSIVVLRTRRKWMQVRRCV
jgi:hypothetical protein